MKKARHSWSKDWHTECKLDSTHIKVDSGTTAATLPTLSTLHVGLPTLSLQNDAIFHFLAKIDYTTMRHTAWVLAVDMKNKTVQRVAEFRPKRSIALSTGYDSSRISKYLKVGPGNCFHRCLTICHFLNICHFQCMLNYIAR